MLRESSIEFKRELKGGGGATSTLSLRAERAERELRESSREQRAERELRWS